MITRSSISLQALFEQLTSEGYLSTETNVEISENMAALATEKSSPWYIQAIIVIAAWLAAIPFLGFLFSFTFLDSSLVMGTIGTFLCIVAIGLSYVLRHSLFVAQLALAFSLAGQMLLIGTVGVETESISLTAMFIIILELILLAVYPDALHRFVSTMLIPPAILTLLFDLEIQETIHLLVLALAVGVVAVWENEVYLSRSFLHQLYRPIGYGLTVSFLYILILSIVNLFGTPWIEIYYWWLSAAALLLILLALEYFIVTDEQLNLSKPLIGIIMGGTFLVFLPTLQAPGIVAAVLIMILGFHRGNLLLLGVAVAFLILFVVMFYYSLSLTLLTKSFMLMGIGLALFVLRALLVNRFTPVGGE